jgi:hypothetical protein
MRTPSARARLEGLDAPRRPLVRRPSPDVTLWRPEIVLASAILPSPPTPSVTLAGPAARPDAVRRHVDSARDVLTSLDAARHTLEARAAAARIRGEQAASARERVTAAIETYRAEAALDDALTRAMREVKILMEERGLR